MMIIDNTFEFGIPTHIKFTLYKFDYIDSIIISRVLKECKNWNTSNDNNVYTITLDSFKSALIGNKRLYSEIERVNYSGLLPTPGLKPNSISFLWSIIQRLHNLNWLTFNISYDKKYTRFVRIENREILSFYFKIDEGVFDLTKIFNRDSLDIINKKLIQFGVITNNYIERQPYFYIKTSLLFELLTELQTDSGLDIFELLVLIVRLLLLQVLPYFFSIL